ncbi:hypothetical protein AGLY_008107 [Aphis glycines]|uniref:Uncharacterized protein n=1 Tax=Aphis glycines TaxID=307491 RepID=A0A6G0TKV7_APHGL|nr:hypothetical protein AGLY_008107 [Aphis glycines]
MSYELVMDYGEVVVDCVVVGGDQSTDVFDFRISDIPLKQYFEVMANQVRYIKERRRKLNNTAHYAYKKHLLQVFMLTHKIVVHNIIIGRKTPLETFKKRRKKKLKHFKNLSIYIIYILYITILWLNHINYLEFLIIIKLNVVPSMIAIFLKEKKTNNMGFNNSNTNFYCLLSKSHVQLSYKYIALRMTLRTQFYLEQYYHRKNKTYASLDGLISNAISDVKIIINNSKKKKKRTVILFVHFVFKAINEVDRCTTKNKITKKIIIMNMNKTYNFFLYIVTFYKIGKIALINGLTTRSNMSNVYVFYSITAFKEIILPPTMSLIEMKVLKTGEYQLQHMR